MSEIPRQPFSVEESVIYLLDQRELPRSEKLVPCRNARQVYSAIRRMVVRGAPVIGTVAAYGLALEARWLMGKGKLAGERLERAAQLLKSARPTAINLSWAVERSLRSIEGQGREKWVSLLEEEAQNQERENIEWTRSISQVGAALIPEGGRVLTICNTGPLATGGFGTALGAILQAYQSGKELEVFVLETRPYLQGARLTTWELKQAHVPIILITDGMAAWTLKSKRIDLVLTGADRIAGNGDTANKIGTYGLALLARDHSVPFYVVAPLSSFDSSLRKGEEIPIEERPPREVLFCGRRAITPQGVRAFNPAFDITPSSLITAIVTEKGILRSPYRESIARALGV